MNTKIPSNPKKHITPGVCKDGSPQDQHGLIEGGTARRRQCSISDEEVEKALDVAAVLLAVADEVGMKGWGLSSPTHCRGPNSGQNYYNNNNNTTHNTAPRSKYAAILASVGCAPPAVQPCPLSLLLPGNTKGRLDERQARCADTCPRNTSSSNRKTNTNLKTFSASFNCRVSSTPFGLCTPKACTTTSPSSPGTSKRLPSNTRLKTPVSERKKKGNKPSMTVTASTVLGDPDSLPVCHTQPSSIGSPSQASLIQSWSSVSSSPSSSSSVATIECESISVTIPDRPKCVMTSSWTNEDYWIAGALPVSSEPQAVCSGSDDWLFVTTEPSSTAPRDSNCPITAAVPTTTSTARLPDVTPDEAAASALSKKALLSSRRPHRQRPLSLPSNHQLDLKLCYFNPDSDLDSDLDEQRTSASDQRSHADHDLDAAKSKRHSLSLRGQGVEPDQWHSQLHPLLHSQSQILEGHDLSRVAKVKILSRTSWCDCSPDFLTTASKTASSSSSSSPEKGPEKCPDDQAGEGEGKGEGKEKEEERGLECKCSDRSTGDQDDRGKMHIPKAPSDEFLTEAMKFTRQKCKYCPTLPPLSLSVSVYLSVIQLYMYNIHSINYHLIISSPFSLIVFLSCSQCMDVLTSCILFHQSPFGPIFSVWTSGWWTHNVLRLSVRHRCLEDLVTLLEQFYKQTQSRLLVFSLCSEQINPKIRD